MIVCLDACFTQKHCKSQGSAWNEPHTHPETVFIPTVEVNEVEKMVESVQPTPKKGDNQKSKSPKKPSYVDSQEPPFEPGMWVPTAVLDGCNDSFVAADERHMKASTLFFADTGLMALICCHDHVLWLVNMTSPGEKQHYAICLLQKLFNYIPETMHMVTNGLVKLFITVESVKGLACLMVKGVKGSGVPFSP